MIYFNVFILILGAFVMFLDFREKSWDIFFSYEIYLFFAVAAFAAYDIYKFIYK